MKDIEIEDAFVVESPDIETEKAVVVPNNTPVVCSNKDEQIDKDLEYARTNIYSLIETGQRALSVLADLAENSQHPRAFEAISTLIQSLTATTKELIELQVTKKEIHKDEKSQPNTTTNNNLILTTDELLKKLMHIKDEDEVS